MEAVAYGDQAMMFDRLLVQDEEYEFMSVGFLPTWVDDMRHVFHLHSDFYVHLSARTMAHAQQSIMGFAKFPRTFMRFNDVYTLDEFIFAGIAHVPIFKITSLTVYVLVPFTFLLSFV